MNSSDEMEESKNKEPKVDHKDNLIDRVLNELVCEDGTRTTLTHRSLSLIEETIDSNHPGAYFLKALPHYRVPHDERIHTQLYTETSPPAWIGGVTQKAADILVEAYEKGVTHPFFYFLLGGACVRSKQSDHAREFFIMAIAGRYFHIYMFVFMFMCIPVMYRNHCIRMRTNVLPSEL